MDSLQQSTLAVLDALMSTDNSARKAAEAWFSQQLEQNCMAMVQTLLGIFSEASGAIVLRSFAGVLLRRAVQNSNFSEADTAVLRGYLIQLWNQEQDPNLLKRLAYVIAQSAQNKAHPWTGMLAQVVANCTTQPTVEVVTAVLTLIEIVAMDAADIIQADVPTLGGFLSSQLGSTHEKIQVACAKAICASILALAEEGSRDAFKPAISPIVAILGGALSRNDEDCATAIMEYLVEIAAIFPIFFKGILDEVIPAMLTVAQSDALEFSTRSTALELMVTLAECAPALARRCGALVQGIVPLCMSIMLDVEETEHEFVTSKFNPDGAVEDNAGAGEDALERASAGIGGRILGPAVVALVQQYASSSDWTYRRAAVAALTRLAEGGAGAFKPNFESAVGFLSGAMADASARVRYEAIITVGRFAELFPQNSERLVTVFVPLLTAMLGEPSTCDRVRGASAMAMINLANPENCEEEYLTETGLLEPLLKALVVCLQSASVDVQPTCLDLLARIAQVSGEKFTPYYSAFMPGVVGIVSSAKGPHLFKLRGKAMHCVGIMGVAVGAEQFTPAALEVMQLLLGDLSGLSTADDQEIAFEYILPACARIAQALGAAFKPFLPAVMHTLFAGANEVITCVIEDATEEDEMGETIRDEEARTETGIVTLPGVGKKRVTMNTYAIHQKQIAARILYDFAEALKGDMVEYLAQAFASILDMVTDKHSAEMREVAVTTLPKLFMAAVDAASKGLLDAGNLNAVLMASITKLLASLSGENNCTTRMCSADSLAKVLQICYDSAAPQVDGNRSAAQCIVRPDAGTCGMMLSQLMTFCKDSTDRRLEQEQAFQSNQGKEAEDKEAFEEEVEEEDDLFNSLADCIGCLQKLHSDTGAIIAQFEAEAVPFFSQYMSAPAAGTPFCDNFQIVASSLLDDILEFGGEAAHKYIAQSVNLFMSNLQSSDNNVLRQISVYGLYQIIKLHPQTMMQALGGDIRPVVHCLLSVINAEDAKDDDHEGITENAVAALGVLVTVPAFRQVVSAIAAGSPSLSQLANLWLQNLPLKLNEPDCKFASNVLVTALEQGDDVIFGGPTFSNIPDVLRILSDILIQAEKLARGALRQDEEEIMASSETLQRCFAVVKNIAAGSVVPSHVTQAAFAGLKPAQQAVLHQVMA